MRGHTKHILQALVLLPATLAWTGGITPMTLQPQSRLWFTGTSTLRSWECSAVDFQTLVQASGPDAGAAVLAGQRAVRSVEVVVPAAKLECRNGTMNGHMRKALRTAEHETIRFRLDGYTVAQRDGGVAGQLTGTLEIAGVAQPITIAAQAEPAADGLLRVTGSHDVAMKQYGVKPPTLMMGTLKVGETVTVKFDLLLKS